MQGGQGEAEAVGRVEEQRDEVLALQAIYPGEVKVGGDGEAECFEIRAAVHPELHDGLVVWARAPPEVVAQQAAAAPHGEQGEHGEEEEEEEEKQRERERAAEPPGWTCPACTFRNQPHHHNCEACSGKRPAMGRVHAANPEVFNTKTAEDEAVAKLEDLERQRRLERDERGFVRPALLVKIDVETGHYKDIPLRFLPPVELHARLPPSYPDAPPEYSLTCPWLGERHIAALSNQLDEVWKAQQGAPIIFVWMDTIASWVQDMLSASEGRLEISAALSPAAGDAEASLLHLVRFDRMRVLEATLSKMFECPICLEEVGGSQACYLGGCEHVCCASCLQAMCRLHISEGSVKDLACPVGGCGNAFAPHVVHRIVQGAGGEEGGEVMFKRYQQLLVQRTVESMKGMCYCPRCDQNGVQTTVMPLKDAPDLCVCPKCKFSFCALCRFDYHPSSKCLSPADRLEFMKELQELKGCGGSLELLVKKARDLRQQALSLSLIQHATVSCPSCSQAVERSEGCNKMTCLCGAKFCFRCGILIQGYDHFWDGGCKLFDHEEIQRIQQREREQHNGW